MSSSPVKTLAVLIEGREAGQLREDGAGRYELVVERIGELAAALPGAMEEAAPAPEVRELGSGLPQKLVEAVAQRAGDCERALD